VCKTSLSWGWNLGSTYSDHILSIISFCYLRRILHWRSVSGNWKWSHRRISRYYTAIYYGWSLRCRVLGNLNWTNRWLWSTQTLKDNSCRIITWMCSPQLLRIGLTICIILHKLLFVFWSISNIWEPNPILNTDASIIPIHLYLCPQHNPHPSISRDSTSIHSLDSSNDHEFDYANAIHAVFRFQQVKTLFFKLIFLDPL
jgi:hypothetical protein